MVINNNLLRSKFKRLSDNQVVFRGFMQTSFNGMKNKNKILLNSSTILVMKHLEVIRVILNNTKGMDTTNGFNPGIGVNRKFNPNFFSLSSKRQTRKMRKPFGYPTLEESPYSFKCRNVSFKYSISSSYF